MVLCWLAIACLSGCEEEPLLLRTMGLRGVPVDQTMPGEVVGGHIEAFGLQLPRDVRYSSKAPDSHTFLAKIPAEGVANFFRDRVENGKIDTGPAATVFRDVTVKAAPERSVDIVVSQVFQGVQIQVTDKTRRPAPKEPDLDEKDRWGRMGLTPDGKVLEEYQQ